MRKLKHLAVTGLLVSIGSVARAKEFGVAEIVVPKNIGARVEWLESKLGPAFEVFGDTRTYEIGECSVDVQTSGGDIAAFSVAINEKCAFDLQAFLPNRKIVPLASLTFGDLDEALGQIAYQADCLTNCGNAADPVIYGSWFGSRADGMMSVVVEIRQVTTGALDAGDKWQDVMVAAEGEDYVRQTKFNCDLKYNETAKVLLSLLKPERVSVGYVNPPIRDCN